MTSNQRKLELHEELKQARLIRREALEALTEARSEYLDRKSAVKDATDAVEEILEEIETGKTPRPLIDYANDRSGMDLVASRPGGRPREGVATPAANGSPIAAKPDPPAKKGRAAKSAAR